MAIQAKKYEMPVQSPEVRAHNFDEVALGYTEEIAVAEANRCLNCVNKPCVKSCPVNIGIPDFISKIKKKDFEGAYKIISENSQMPAVCGRVCPQENQCEGSCTLGIKFEPVAIGRLERFVADNYNSQSKAEIISIPKNDKRIAVIGSGPAGLACAGTLVKKGYNVTVFEALHKLGGVLTYGIPEFRLPKRIVDGEIATLKKYGVDFQTNIVIGKTITIDELFEEGYNAVFIGTGAGLPRFMNIAGESLNGVYSANEFLTRINLMKAYDKNSHTPIMKAKKVAVIGGGNVAMDAARTALRLGAENVKIIYRRSMEELPARKEEVEHAIEEGIEFELLRNPVEILSKDGFVGGIKIIKCKLGDADDKGRRRPVEIPDSEYILDVDCVIMAIGTTPNPLIKNSTKNLAYNSHGGIVVRDETGETTMSGVYAGGDVVTGAATVILAMGAGKSAALSIDKKLSYPNNLLKTRENSLMQVDMNLSNIVETAEFVNIYNDGNSVTYGKEEKPFCLAVEGWKDLMQNTHEMPAYGVSLNRETTEAMKDGLWIEFDFRKQCFYNEMPFEKLLVKIEKLYQGFNIIRYNSKGGYDGRCYYVDLVNKNMADFYSIIANLSN